ncbi:MAG: hypothetical protein QM742_12565 [Aquabacterium sp.]
MQVEGTETLVKAADLLDHLVKGNSSDGALESRMQQNAGLDDAPQLNKLDANTLGSLDQSMLDQAALKDHVQADGSLIPPPPVGEATGVRRPRRAGVDAAGPQARHGLTAHRKHTPWPPHPPPP